MKIIGRTSSGYIAEISNEDIAALVGDTHYSFGSTPDKIGEAFGRKKPWPDSRLDILGASIDLAGRFRRVVAIEERHADLGKKAESLRLLASALDAVAAAPLTLAPLKDGEN
ncbi:hypothetical protein [Nitrobacter sp.]|uniref:hypothetical protein n=1 Tax=Nitrobacter sp. TaxID=29420 RepID=UPI0029CABF26|nr:hypothetical protein [Nitrobacter sp.]